MSWLKRLSKKISELKYWITYPRYAVIIDLPEAYDGCECDELLIGRPNEYDPNDLIYHLPTDEEFDKSDASVFVHARLPAFKIGEILLLNECERDILDHRRPSKHWVEAKYFRFSWQAAREVRRMAANKENKPSMERWSVVLEREKAKMEARKMSSE